jgi:hypothetical protein
VQLFGVAIVVLLSGIALLVLQRSAARGRPRTRRHESNVGSTTGEPGRETGRRR